MAAQRSIVEDEEGADTRCIRSHHPIPFKSIVSFVMFTDSVAACTFAYHALSVHVHSRLLLRRTTIYIKSIHAHQYM